MNSPIELSASLRKRIEDHIAERALPMTLQEACEYFIVRGLTEAEQHKDDQYEKPSEDVVKNRLQSLGYID